MREREFHAVADLFPLMQGAAFADLAADIKKNGLREPILVDAEGRILDGRNRYRACLAAGVEPQFVEWDGKGELAELALSLNLRRRHLNESQRAMVAARLAKMLRDAVGKFANGKPLRTHDEAGKMVNISSRLVGHALRVVDKGSPELIAAVESGAMAVSKASALAGGAKPAARKARAPRRSPGRFGVVPMAVADPQAPMILWVSADGFDEAMDALRARGFEMAATPVNFQPGQAL